MKKRRGEDKTESYLCVKNEYRGTRSVNLYCVGNKF